MRYYRLWIYSCNLALLLSVLAFVALAAWILSDFHMALFPSIQMHQPSLLYAYLAVAFQGGILQAIGCIGALRMNERLLNIYWTLMLLLLFGDVIVGVVWLFRFHYLTQNLKDDLRLRLQQQYGVDAEFQLLWDRIQTESQCCGIGGPHDFNGSEWLSRQHQDYVQHRQVVPRSCCKMHSVPNYQEEVPLNQSCVESYQASVIHLQGCYDAVHRWLQHAVDLLSVLGFCVISFLKLCFLGILRYEIREMIQKIKILKCMDGQSPFPSLEASFPRPFTTSTGQPTSIDPSSTAVNHNCAIPNEKPPNGNNNDTEVHPLKRSSPV